MSNARILKYKLTDIAFSGVGQDIILPKHTELLKVAEQDNVITLWFLTQEVVDERSVRTFRVFGTGWDIAEDYLDGLRHVDSVCMSEGLVWHVFEVV